MKVRSFVVLPDTPEKLMKLNELAHNLYFSWHPEVTRLFKKLCPVSWEASKGNPAKMRCLIQTLLRNQLRSV